MCNVCMLAEGDGEYAGGGTKVLLDVGPGRSNAIVVLTWMVVQHQIG